MTDMVEIRKIEQETGLPLYLVVTPKRVTALLKQRGLIPEVIGRCIVGSFTVEETVRTLLCQLQFREEITLPKSSPYYFAEIVYRNEQGQIDFSKKAYRK